MRRIPQRTPIGLSELFDDVGHYAVTFSLGTTCTVPREDPSQYTQVIKGTVLLDTDHEAEEVVGNFEGLQLRCDLAVEDGVPFDEIADAFDQSMHDDLLEVFTPEGELRPEILDIFKGQEPISGPVLIPQTLNIHPAHRGQGLGYAVMNSFIETFEPGASIVIARAAPINAADLTPEAIETVEYRQSRAVGVRKLRRYWRRLGFIPTSADSNCLVLNLALKRPTVTEAIIAARRAKSRRRS